MLRKDAAAEDQSSAVFTTLTNARARGGVIQTLAEERLGGVEKILLKLAAEREPIAAALMPLEANIDTVDIKADNFIGEKADEMWNKLGRPGFDAFFSLLFPGGISAYTEVSDEEQPAYMGLLADLLESGIHPRLDLTYTKAIATELRAIAADYDAAVKAVLPLRLKLRFLDKTFVVVARSGQVQLSNLKRRLLSEGFSQADVHEIIPSVPARRKKDEPKS